MGKIIKLGLVGGVLLSSVGYLVFGRESLSYLLTAFGVARRSVQESVSLDFQLQRARDLTQHIQVDMQRLLEAYTRQQLSVEDLTAKVQEAEASNATAQLRTQVVALRDELARGTGDKQAEARLADLFAVYKARKDLLTHLKATLGIKIKALQGLKDRLAAVRGEKERCDLEIEKLAALAQYVKATDPGPDADPTAETVSRVREILNDAEQKIRFLARQAENRQELLPETTASKPEVPQGQALTTVTEYLAAEEGTAPRSAHP